jgi:hypothetical protein
MKYQLIPPPELAPPSVSRLLCGQRVMLWSQIVDEGDRIVLSNLRQKLGPAADLQAATLAWLERRNAEHDRTLERMITDMRRRERANAR